MAAEDFDGQAVLVGAIDDAVALGDPEAITHQLRSSLSELIGSGRVRLPEAVFTPLPDRYARRLLHQSPRYGYSVIAMTWGPGQGTLIHDHDGLWCVEGVWSGRLEITPYDLLEADGERMRFAAQPVIHAGCGSTGSLIPPFEYHTIRNPDEREASVTVHVYSQAMNRCAVFEPAEPGWHRRRHRSLSLEPA